MPINPEDLKRLDDALVNEEDEPEPVPQGWGVYVTPKFLSQVVLGVYGLMLAVMLVVRWTVHTAMLPVMWMVTPVLAVLPIVLAALYLAWVTPPEPQVAAMRTRRGRIVTFVLVYMVMQVVTVLLWLAIDRMFTLR